MKATKLITALLFIGHCTLNVAARAADHSPKPTIASSETLGDWLKPRFAVMTSARDAAFEKLSGQKDLRRWQSERRSFLRRQIGEFPERTPLNSLVVGRLQGDGYRVEKVMFESRPQHHVTANLYLPESTGPYPAILIPCGHSHTGKASGQYQRAAILFARHGMAALCYDPVSQGERYQVIDPDGGHTHFDDIPRQLAVPHPNVRHLCTTEHTLIGIGSILLGENIAQHRVWDGMRAIDYLQSREDIQADKIGCTGNSGGGTLTSYLMALDDRIVAASPGCYLTSFQRLIETKGPQDGEQNIFGQVAFGMDAADYVIMRAPVPILICASTRDATFDILGTREVFHQANRFYSHLGFPERVAMNEADAPHGYLIQHREAVARWMHRWLIGRDKVIWEKPRSEWPAKVSDEFLRSLSEGDWTAEELQCSPRGQVMLMDGQRSAFQINAEKASALAKSRQAKWDAATATEKRNIVRRAIGMKEVGPARFVTTGSVKAQDYTINDVQMHRKDAIVLSAKSYIPNGEVTGHVLYLHGKGMSADDVPVALVKEGNRVLVAELSGIGMTDVPPDKRTWGYGRFGRDNQEILTAYLMGDSFVRMRVADAFSWASHFGEAKVEVIGVGEAAIPALHAAALAPEQFHKVKLEQMIASWADVVSAPEHYNQLVNAVHGVHRHYDLPDLVKLTSADVSNTVDVNWNPDDDGELEVVVSPRVTVVQREGITGGGCPVVLGNRVLNFYANHPDDFGGSTGMASAISTDGGLSWKKGQDNWPMSGMIAMWPERLKSGNLLAFGIRWLPDPAKRREAKLPNVPADAYQIAVSKDQGRSWKLERATIECPSEVGGIARPVPHIMEDENGLLLMPAYTWSKRGNKVVLLQSEDGGRVWKVRSVITTAVAMIQAGANVRTPWLEATVSATKNGEMLAVVRTGSTTKSNLVSVRSTDGGKTWRQPKMLPFAGKLPTLQLLPNGVLTLTTALSRNHCRVYLSADGTGRQWSRAFVISSLTGGNVGAAVAGDDKLLITSPANRRIDAWHLRVGTEPAKSNHLETPTNLNFKKGTLTWSASPGAVAYRVTPVLMKPGDLWTTTKIQPCAAIQTLDDSTSLDLSCQLLLGSVYAFDVAAVDAKGRVSPATRSQEFQLP